MKLLKLSIFQKNIFGQSLFFFLLILTILTQTTQTFGAETKDDDDEGIDTEILVDKNSTSNGSSGREPKMTRFWEVVNVPATSCMSTGGMRGVCTSKKACQKGSGTMLGNSCENGFGVCCSFNQRCVANNNGAPTIVRYSGTHILPPTTPFTLPLQCQFRIQRRSNICQLRLDFQTFMLANPTPQGDCVTDVLTISGADNLDGFVACGNGTGQHLYLHYGNSDLISLHLSLGIRADAAASNYDILATMIPCANSGSGGKRKSRRFMNTNSNSNGDSNSNQDTSFELEPAPFGCAQYYTRATDTVRSFNYRPTANPSGSMMGIQINNEEYNVCVKTVPGSKQIRWTPCTEANNSFFISGTTQGSAATVDCDTDYVDIPGGLPTGRFCGGTFPTSVTSNAKPYSMYVRFDDTELFGSDFPVDPVTGCQIGFICMRDGIPGEGCMPFATPPVGMCFPGPAIIARSDFENLGFCLQYTIS